jgi:hypothetical protein
LGNFILYALDPFSDSTSTKIWLSNGDTHGGIHSLLFD